MTTRTALLINGDRYEVDVLERTHRAVRFSFSGREYIVELEESTPQAKAPITAKAAPRAASQPAAGGKPGQIFSGLPGVVVDVLVKTGQRVEAGAVLLRIEAMKMQNSIFAPSGGTVREIHVDPGMEVGDGQLLMELEVETK